MKSGSGLPGRRTWKKLMVWVRPGVLLVLAILLPTRALIKLDLPTFERPRKAISGAPAGGNCFGSTAAVTKRVRTFMPSLYIARPRRKGIEKEHRGFGLYRRSATRRRA